MDESRSADGSDMLRRNRSGVAGDSTRTTSAPRKASSSVAYGPAATQVRSTTRRPASGSVPGVDRASGRRSRLAAAPTDPERADRRPPAAGHRAEQPAGGDRRVVGELGRLEERTAGTAGREQRPADLLARAYGGVALQLDGERVGVVVAQATVGEQRVVGEVGSADLAGRTIASAAPRPAGWRPSRRCSAALRRSRSPGSCGRSRGARRRRGTASCGSGRTPPRRRRSPPGRRRRSGPGRTARRAPPPLRSGRCRGRQESSRRAPAAGRERAGRRSPTAASPPPRRRGRW